MAAKRSPKKGKSSKSLEIAVLRSITLLTSECPDDFLDLQWPPNSPDSPKELQAWIKRADPQEVRGLLVAALRRWHQLHGHD